MKNANVSDADLLRWERVLVEDYARLEEGVRSGNTQKGRRVYQLFRENVHWAGLAQAKCDSALVRQRLTAAAEYFMLLRAEVDAGRADARFLAEGAEDALNVGLVLNDRDYLERIRSLFAEHHEGSVAEYGRAVFCILDGSLSEAVESIDELERQAKLRFGGAVPLILRALVNKNSEQFRDALQELLREFDRYASGEARGTPEAALFLRGSAMLALCDQVQASRVRHADMDPRLARL